jgi:hypothetical protein
LAHGLKRQVSTLEPVNVIVWFQSFAFTFSLYRYAMAQASVDAPIAAPEGAAAAAATANAAASAAAKVTASRGDIPAPTPPPPPEEAPSAGTPYKFANAVDPELESAWFLQPLSLKMRKKLVSNFAFPNLACTATRRRS